MKYMLIKDNRSEKLYIDDSDQMIRMFETKLEESNSIQDLKDKYPSAVVVAED